MPSFQLSGLHHEAFEPMFALSDAQLLSLGAVRRFAAEASGFPCRVSLQDADVGDELLLLPFQHQSAASPYRASGRIFVRRGARQRTLPTGVVPPYVSKRLISLRAYDIDDMMIDASVGEGPSVAVQLDQLFCNRDVAYVHLNNAKRGCFSCLASRVV